MSSVDPFYTRKYRRADDDVAQRFREHEADDVPPQREHDDGFGLYVALSIFCVVASGAVAMIFILVILIMEIL